MSYVAGRAVLVKWLADSGLCECHDMLPVSTLPACWRRCLDPRPEQRDQAHDNTRARFAS